MSILKKLFLLILCFTVIELCGFSAGKIGTTAENKPLVGICMCNMMEECWYKDKDTLVHELKAFGMDVLVQNANNSQNKQNEQISYLVEKGAQVLIVIPVSSSGAAEAVKEARSSGVKVIAYERLIKNTEIDAYYAFDNEKVGELLAEGLLSKISTGHIMIINGDPEDENTNYYSKGYYDVLGPYMTAGSITVLRTAWAARWKKEEGYNSVEKAIESGIKLNGVIAASDSLAEMAIEALSETGLAGKTVVVGQNGDLAACQRILEGVQTATVIKDFESLARKTAQAAFRMANDFPYITTSTTQNGWGDIPSYLMPPTLVTKDNFEKEIITGGIYSYNEVFRKDP